MTSSVKQNSELVAKRWANALMELACEDENISKEDILVDLLEVASVIDSSEELSNVINNPEYWYDKSCTPKYNNTNSKSEHSFFKVIRQQDNEVVFSSVFYHYLSLFESL